MREEYEKWFAEKFGHAPMPLDSHQIDFCWYGYQAGVESMRQELSNKDTEIEYLNWYTNWLDDHCSIGWDKVDELQQQLAEALAATARNE